MGNEGQKNKPSQGEPSSHALTMIIFIFELLEPVLLLARLLSWVSCSLLPAPGGDHAGPQAGQGQGANVEGVDVNGPRTRGRRLGANV